MTAVHNVSTIDGLVHLADFASDDLVDVGGFRSVGDGGGGRFFFQPATGAGDDSDPSWVGDHGTTFSTNAGEVAGRWHRLFDGPLNARWFGAANSTDAWAALRNALAALSRTGTDPALGRTPVRRALYIPAGIYPLSRPLAIDSLVDARIFGDGANHTQLVAGRQNTEILQFTGSCGRIDLAGLWLGSADKAQSKTTYGLRITGPDKAEPCHDFHVRDVVVQDMGGGIVCRRLFTGVWQDVVLVKSPAGDPWHSMKADIGWHVVRSQGQFLERCFNTVFPASARFGKDVLVLDSDLDTIVVDSCQFGSAGPNGRAIHLVNRDGGETGPRLVRLVNTYAEHCEGSGFGVSEGRDVRLQGCHAADNRGHGFEVTGGDSINLDDCFAAANDLDGITVSRATGVKIVGCTASNNSRATPTEWSGIRVGSTEDAIKGVRVVGNRSGDFVYTGATQRHGIVVGTAAKHVVVALNDVRQNVQAGVEWSVGDTTILVGDNIG